ARLGATAAEAAGAAERVATARATEPAERRARVVLLALLGIAEDVVRGRDLLELFLGLFVAGVAVRVIFARQFPVRLLDLVLARVLLDAEGLVELVCHFSRLLFRFFFASLKRPPRPSRGGSAAPRTGSPSASPRPRRPPRSPRPARSRALRRSSGRTSRLSGRPPRPRCGRASPAGCGRRAGCHAPARPPSHPRDRALRPA